MLNEIKKGTRTFMAPEVWALRSAKKGERVKYNESCDIWSCGVILFLMFAAR